MTKRVLASCLILVPSVLAASERTVTIEEALRLAEASPAASALALEIDRARAEVRASGLRPNPEVFLSREEAAGTVDRFATLTVPTPLTGRLRLEKAAALSGLAAGEARSRQVRLEFRARVREAFVDLLAAQERESALADGLSRLSELVEVLRAREREGESSGFDRMRAERERADVEADFLGSRGLGVRAREAFTALLALPSGDLRAEGTLEPRGVLPGRDDVRALTGSRGDILALVKEAERADHLAQAARRRAVPEPSFTVGAKTTEVGDASGSGGVAAVSVPVPLFDRGQGVRAVAQAEGALLRARREVLVRQAQAEAQAALAEAAARREAEQAYAAAEDPEDLARIARTAYEAGEMRILDLLDAYRTALAVRLRMIDLRVDARGAEVELDRSVGAEVVR